jgi:RNA polymerase sigma-70 factor (ECF subfamily)
MPKIDFEQVYNQHYDTIFNYCSRRTGDFDISRDITSETFLKAYLNIHKFRWKGIPVINWLYRIASNEIRLYYRARQYRAKLVQRIYLENPIRNQSGLDLEKTRAQQELEQNERFRKVRQTIATLPAKYQEVITLKHFEQMTISEISSILGKKEGTVKSLLSRGMARLREMM